MRKQGSKYQLANATPENVASVVVQARERGWTDAQLRKHGNDCVRVYLERKTHAFMAAAKELGYDPLVLQPVVVDPADYRGMPRIITGAPGENPDDCTTHDHEPLGRLSSGNVFEDLGFENPEQELAAADARIAELAKRGELQSDGTVEARLIASMQQAVEIKEGKRKPARVTTVELKQPAVAYSATQRSAEVLTQRPQAAKRRRQARAQRPVAEVLPLELVRNGVHYSAQVVVWPPRPKQRGPGLTHDAAVVLAGERHACTLSPTAVLRLQGGERVELYLPCEDGKAHGFVARKAEVQ